MAPPVAVQFTAVFAVPVTVAVNCRVAPGATVAPVGDRATDTTGTALTVTVVGTGADPPAVVAVSVSVVEALGVTVTEVPVTVPGAGLILNEVAPETDQLSVALCPA